MYHNLYSSSDDIITPVSSLDYSRVGTFCFCILCQTVCVVNLSVNALANANSLLSHSKPLDTTPQSPADITVICLAVLLIVSIV